MYELKLFVIKKSKNGIIAVKNLKAILGQGFEEKFSLEIIDVFEDPTAANEYDIMATPALLKLTPEPPKRIVGDLSDADLVKLCLGIDIDDDER